MSKKTETGAAKVHVINFSEVSWDLSRNLAREVLSQGDRLTVYNDLLATALRGDPPTILQPIQAARPDANKEVAFIVAGVGRLTSVRKWELASPEERLRDAMLLYRSTKGTVEFIPDEQQQRIAKGVFADVPFAEMDGEGKPPISKVRIAFEATVKVPVVWSDLALEQAESVAVRDLVVRQGGSTADRLMIYSRDIVKDFSSKGKIAVMLNVSPPQVSKYARWHNACVDKVLSPQTQNLVKLHNGSIRVAKPCQFDKMLAIFKIGLRGARLKDVKGKPLAQYSPDEQDGILSAALLTSWNTLGREGVCPSMLDATNSDLLLIQYPDLVTAVQGEEARIIKLVQAKEAAEVAAKADASDGSEVPEDSPAVGDGDTSTQPSTSSAPAPPVTKPTLEDIVAFVDKARWDNTIAGPIVAPFRRFVLGELSAQACADMLAEARHNRQRKGKVTGLPTEVGKPVTVST